MTFTSFHFLLFFPAVVLLYNLCPQRFRVWFLLAVSYAFYAFMQPVYLLLLAAVTATTYAFSRCIGASEDDRRKHKIMVGGIVSILLPLFFFKYLVSIFNFQFSIFNFSLPVGISFYTFMAIGYLVDVNNEEVPVEKNIGSLALFLSFFPYILSGPIERARNILPQFKKLPSSRPADLSAGFKLMLWGYFMKLCVADRLAIYDHAVFGNLLQHNGSTIAFATLLYPIQVYADLGGYSLIAIGVARCLGLKIIPNFNRPFFATSMSHLWHRWHMSLISWLTDYLYTPLSFALRRWKVWGIVTAIILTFLISGIWHAAALGFLLWGVIQGLYLSIEALLQKKRSTFENKHDLTHKWWYILICCVGVYLMFAISMIFGSGDGSLSDALTAIGKIFGHWGTLFVDPNTLFYALIFTLVMIAKDFCEEFFPGKIKVFGNKHIVVRFLGMLVVLLFVLYAGVLDGGSFIYFQF